MANILLIETATTEVCSVAISSDGKIIAFEETLGSPVNHPAILTNQILACLEQSRLRKKDLNAIAVSSGPGSYSSLRTGIATAKGLCYGLALPLIAVSTLKALAWASREMLITQHPEIWMEELVYFAPMIDARRNEVCSTLFDKDLNPLLPSMPMEVSKTMFQPHFEALPELISMRKRYILSGNGAQKAKIVLENTDFVNLKINTCSSYYLARLAEDMMQINDFQGVLHYFAEYMKPVTVTQSRSQFF